MLVNRVKSFVDSRGISVYQFYHECGISRTIAYAIYNDPGTPIGSKVLDAICTRYKVQPNELILWVETEND